MMNLKLGDIENLDSLNVSNTSQSADFLVDAATNLMIWTNAKMMLMVFGDIWELISSHQEKRPPK